MKRKRAEKVTSSKADRRREPRRRGVPRWLTGRKDQATTAIALASQVDQQRFVVHEAVRRDVDPPSDLCLQVGAPAREPQEQGNDQPRPRLQENDHGLDKHVGLDQRAIEIDEQWGVICSRCWNLEHLSMEAIPRAER
jgi:hypothetical protein